MSFSEEIYVGPMIRIKKSIDFHESDFCYNKLDEKLFSPEIENADSYCYLLPNQEEYFDENSEFKEEGYVVIISDPAISILNFSIKTEKLRALIPVPYEIVYGVLRYYM